MNKMFQELREKYKPSKIKCLLIAESPPKSGVFFYDPEREKQSYLFSAVMEVVFSDFKDKYKKGKGVKHVYLQKFKEKGFYLIDAVDEPINHLDGKVKKQKIKENLENKIKEIEKLVSKDIPIIIIIRRVFHIFFDELKNRGFNVAHENIPYPSPWHQKKFKKNFKLCLKKC